MSNVTIASGGVLPHVHAELLAKKKNTPVGTVANIAASSKKGKVIAPVRKTKSAPAKSNLSKKGGSAKSVSYLKE